MKSRLPYAAAALSGVLLILIFPKFNYEALAWVALVPLLWAIRGQSSGKAALLGFIAGWIFFTGLLYWIYVVLTFYGHLPPPVSVSILLLMTAYLGLYVSAFAFLMRWIRLRSAVPEILLAPSLWVALEFIRGVLFSGFPWENLGYSQFLARSIVQMADVAGVHGVSFLIVLVNAAIYRLTVSLWQGRWRSALPDIAAAAALVLVVGVYGQARLARLDDEARRGKSLRVALIQGNIPQDVKWEPKFQAETMRIYGDLTLQAAPADLIIWPETATPFFFQEQRLFRNQILDLAARKQTSILFGAPAFDRRGGGEVYFNSAFLVSPAREILGRYDKIHLVPFGEYAPLSGLLGFTRDIIGAIGDFTPGKGVHNLSLSPERFGTLICYEAIFPDLTRQFVEQDADFLVNITNDAWFGRTAAPFQHLSMVTLRAVENRVPIARAANTGISALIDATGRVTVSSALFTREVLSGNIKLVGERTFFTRWGDWTAYVSLAASAFFLILALLKRGHRVERGSRKNLTPGR